MSYYGDLIHKLKVKLVQISFYFYFTQEHIKTVNKVNKVNSELRKLCKRKNLLFCNLCKSFLYNNYPHPTLFAPKDGLHLNYAGTYFLRQNIINIIRHLSVH